MKWIKENILNILVIYINIFFIMKILIGSYGIVNEDWLRILGLIILGTVIYWIFHTLLHKSRQKVIFLLITMAIILGATIIFRGFIENFIYSGIVSKIDNINTLLNNDMPISFDLFNNIFLVTIPGITIIVLWLSARGYLDSIVLVSFAVMTFLWSLGYLDGIIPNLFSFMVIVAVTIGVNNHNRFMKKTKEQRIRRTRPIKVFIPIIVSAILISIIPGYFPYAKDGRFVEEWIQKFNEKVVKGWSPDGLSFGGTGSNNQYTLKSSGYSDSSTKLEGKLKLDYSPVLRVYSDKPIYLKGSVKDKYDGSSWRSQLSDYEKRNYFIRGYYWGDELENTSSKAVRIKPLANFKNIFLPNQTLSLTADRTFYLSNDGEVGYFNKSNNDEYTIEFIEEDMNLNGSFGYKNKDYDFINENFKEYLTLYPGITDRTIDLVNSFKTQRESDLTLVKKIKSYVSGKYPYSLSVSDVPRGVDFVDYYLFQEGKGYCVYSASAITVMLRIAGIPARYVEGFKVSGDSTEGYYTVTNANAHAWTEALIFDGYGYRWITVDASTTPAEFSGDLNPQETETEAPQGGINNEEIPEADNPETDNPVVNGPSEEGNQQENTDDTKEGNYYQIVYVVAAVLFTGILWFSYLAFRKKRIINAKNLAPMYYYFSKRLRGLGYIKPENLTEKEFIATIKEGELRDEMSKLIELVYLEHYGGIVKKSDKNAIYSNLEKVIKKYQGGIKYYLNKFLLRR